jgi:hypothetical protein
VSNTNQATPQRHRGFFRWFYSRLAIREERLVIRALGVLLLGFWGVHLYNAAPPLAGTLRAFSEPVESPATVVGWKKTEGTLWARDGDAAHSCRGGDTWPPFATVAPRVVYERSNPKHCRAAQTLGTLSYHELRSVLECVMFIWLGLALLLAEPDTQRLRRWFSHGVFWLWPVFALGDGAWQMYLNQLRAAAQRGADSVEAAAIALPTTTVAKTPSGATFVAQV